MHGALENLSPLRVEPGERVQIRQQVLREVDESLARDLEMLAADPGNRGSGQALGQRFLSYAGIPDDVRSRVPELAELWRRADLYADVLRTIEIDVPSEAATRGATSRVTCRGLGCNGCCHQGVAVSTAELDVIAVRLGPEQWARVRAHDGGERSACPMLDPATGGCSVYDVRPTICRIYAVVTDPALCSGPAGTEVCSVQDETWCNLTIDVLLDPERPELAPGLKKHELAPWRRG